MRYKLISLGFALLLGACGSMIETALTVNDPTESRGSPETTGFALIDCDAQGRDNNVRRCAIVREGHEQIPIGTDMQLGCFYFPGLQPGRYCIKAIEGYREVTQKDEWGESSVVQQRYCYSLPLWKVPEVIFEVKRGVPIYVGKIKVGRAYKKGFSITARGETENVTIERMGRSEGVWIDKSPKHEKKIWEWFLKRFPESLWAQPVRERYAELQKM